MTPGEEMFLEVLAARYRLGEHLWPFPTNTQRWARTLEARGLIWTTHGQTERTFRAGLTADGIKETIDPTYTPPALRGRTHTASATCYFHPEVGPTFACARCRIGNHTNCILLEA